MKRESVDHVRYVASDRLNERGIVLWIAFEIGILNDDNRRPAAKPVPDLSEADAVIQHA